MTAWALYDEAVTAAAPPDLVLRARDGREWPFPVARWAAPPDRADSALLARCAGPTLDVGCGPGRLVGALAARGVPALGVDPSPAAVRSSLARGGTALRRSVFDRLPGEGRWHRVVLVDGNIGIGGDVPALLSRIAALLGPGGQALVEAEPSTVDEVVEVRLEHPDGRCGPPWWWARVGGPALRRHAAAARLAVSAHWHQDGRSFAALVRAR
jgi:SAM-dependent methyltransferase